MTVNWDQINWPKHKVEYDDCPNCGYHPKGHELRETDGQCPKCLYPDNNQ